MPRQRSPIRTAGCGVISSARRTTRHIADVRPPHNRRHRRLEARSDLDSRRRSRLVDRLADRLARGCPHVRLRPPRPPDAPSPGPGSPSAGITGSTRGRRYRPPSRERLSLAGLEDEQATYAYGALHDFVTGHVAIQLGRGAFDSAPADRREASVFALHHDPTRRFEFGVALILDGVASIAQQGTTS